MYKFLPLLLSLLIASTITTSSIAQISHDGHPVNWDDATFNPVFEMKTMPEINVEALAIQDAVTDQYKEAPWRFGVEQEVLIILRIQALGLLKMVSMFGD